MHTQLLISYAVSCRYNGSGLYAYPVTDAVSVCILRLLLEPFHDAGIAPPLYTQYPFACPVVLPRIIILLDNYHAVCACVGVVVGVHVHADPGDRLAVRYELLIGDAYLVTLQQYGLWFDTLSGEAFCHVRRYGKDHHGLSGWPLPYTATCMAGVPFHLLDVSSNASLK